MQEWVNEVCERTVFVENKQVGRDAIDILISAGCYINRAYTMDSFMAFAWSDGRTIFVSEDGQIDHSIGTCAEYRQLSYEDLVCIANPIKHVCNANVADIF